MDGKKVGLFLSVNVADIKIGGMEEIDEGCQSR